AARIRDRRNLAPRSSGESEGGPGARGDDPSQRSAVGQGAGANGRHRAQQSRRSYRQACKRMECLHGIARSGFIRETLDGVRGMSVLDHLSDQELGQRLRIARESAKLRQEDAAERLGMSRTTVVAVEKGDRRARFEEVRAFAQLYGTSVNALLR